jgi:hypothetical protein
LKARFGFELVEIGGVALDVEAHVARMETNDGIGMGSAIEQEMVTVWAVASVPYTNADLSVPKVKRRVESMARA